MYPLPSRVVDSRLGACVTTRTILLTIVLAISLLPKYCNVPARPAPLYISVKYFFLSNFLRPILKALQSNVKRLGAIGGLVVNTAKTQDRSADCVVSSDSHAIFGCESLDYCAIVVFWAQGPSCILVRECVMRYYGPLSEVKVGGLTIRERGG